MVSTEKPLSYVVKQLGKIDLPEQRTIFPLQNDLVFVVNSNDNLIFTGEFIKGSGHEFHTVQLMMGFANEGETYVEVGANYGDFSLQLSKKVGDQGKVYALEPGYKVYQCLNMSVNLNEITNIVTENLAVLDEEQVITFFEDDGNSLVSTISKNDGNQKVNATTLDKYFSGRETSLDLLRIDAEGSECKIIKGAENIINSSPNLKMFVEWQPSLLGKYETEESLRKCITDLTDKDFIFLDTNEFNINCDYRNYQIIPEEIFHVKTVYEFIAVREDTLKSIKSNTQENSNNECNFTYSSLINDYLDNKNIEGFKNILQKYNDRKIDINIMHSIGATLLHLAVEKGNYEFTKLLLEKGANPNIKAQNDLTALYQSVVDNNYPITKLLLSNGADTEVTMSSGSTPLFAASYFGFNRMLNLLLEHNANKDVQVQGVNAFHVALQNGHFGVAMTLAGSEVHFCEQIAGTEYVHKYIELCKDFIFDL